MEPLPRTFEEKVVPLLSLDGLDIMPSNSEKEYHNTLHAFSVGRVAQQLLREDSHTHTNYEYNILQLASYFHDTGHTNGPTDGHEKRSCTIFRELCEDYRERGYTIPESVEDDVCRVIFGTVFLEEPETYLARILSDADVWNFGASWDTFYNKTVSVQKEFAPTVSEDEWIGFRVQILKEHTYYTKIGKQFFAEEKERNIKKIEDEYPNVTEKPW